MNALCLSLTAMSLCLPLAAQVSEIPAMSIGSSRVDIDAINNGGPGATSLAAIRAAGAPTEAEVAQFVLTPTAAPQGFYNFNLNGNGLGLDPNGALATIIPLSYFTAFEARIDFDTAANEFGFSVGDWSGGMIVEFRRRQDDSLVASYHTSAFATTATKFLRSEARFDRVVLRGDAEAANWVLTELIVPTTPPWTAFGQGCPGASGQATLLAATEPVIGTTFSLSVTEMPATGGLVALTLGLSTTTDPVLGPLPVALTAVGAPGCSLLCSVEQIYFQVQTTGSIQFDLPVPADAALVGFEICNQAFVQDFVNAFGFVATNGGFGYVQS